MKKITILVLLSLIGLSSAFAQVIMDELNGSTLGTPNGITYTATPNGQGAVFTITNESSIEYPFSNGLPHQGTIEMLIYVTSGYSYNDYVLTANQTSALIFTTNPMDVWYLGAMWLSVDNTGGVTLTTALTSTPTSHSLSASATTFSFNEWHVVSFSYGSQGQYLKVDGQLVASNPSYTETLQACGDWGSNRDIPLVGKEHSVFWDHNQYDNGFEGTLDRFRVSSTQQDWLLADVGSITGTVRYQNTDSTIIAFCKVILWDNQGNRFDSAYTSMTGSYSFTAVPLGTYHLTAHPNQVWGGINSNDALIVAKHYVHILTLTGLYKAAADVNGSNSINSLDALLIQKRFTLQISAFPIKDWISENKTATIATTVNQTINIRVISTGDVNGSFLPNNNGLPCPSQPSFTYGGQIYNTLQVGTQCVMKENLNIGTYVQSISTGSDHSDVFNNGIIEKYCYNNDQANCAIYGGLYDWNEMMQYSTTEGIQGICPAGWHIPTNAEWCTLTTYLDPTVNCSTIGWTGTNAGGKMKETGFVHWNSPNTGATNESGFAAFGAGYRYGVGDLYYLQLAAGFWSSSQYGATYAWYRGLDYGNADIYQDLDYKAFGFSLRCFKDTCTQVPSQSNAGPNQTIIGTTATLAANVPSSGTGNWSILSGTGGVITQTSNPISSFGGTIGTTYTLSWTISTACASSIDTVIITFTAPAFTCGISTFIYGGQTYNTVQIGTQCVMKENLNIGTYIPSVYTGWDHSDVTNNGIIEKYCYNNDQANCAIYGGLYDWNEMMQYSTTAGIQGICPAGWHIPTDAEWTTLVTYLGGESVAGGKMKETGFVHWSSPNTGATNLSGFAAFGAGYRISGGHFDGLQSWAHFWSSSQYSSTNAWYRYLSYGTTNITQDYTYKSDGFSLRCFKDTCTQVPSQSNAGPNQTIIGTIATLAANVPSSGTGNWSILSGTGGVITQTSNPISSFGGTIGTTYTLSWTISTACASSIDTVIITFTAPAFTCGTSTFIYGGQTYNTVQIGTQCIMKENLNIGTYVPSISGGSNHSDVSNNGIIEKYCYNNDPANCAIYGGLYDWNEMMQYSTTAGIQGICPTGWHIPTDAEWTTLVTYLGGESVAGGKMKETGFTHWSSPNTGATNLSGFAAFGAGYRYNYGGFDDLQYYANFWSSSQGSSTTAGLRGLYYYDASFGQYGGLKTDGFSVRCFKD